MIRAARIPLLALLAVPVFGYDPCTEPLCVDDGFGAQGKRTVGFNLGDDDRDVGNAVVRAPGEDAIFVVGQVAIAAGNTDYGVIRLNDVGTLDGSFSIDGRATYSFAIVPDGVESANDAAVVPWGLGSDWRLAVVGQVERATPGDVDFGILLLRPDGELETDGSGGKRVVNFDAGDDGTDVATAVAVDSQGRIVVGGTVDVGPGDRDWGFVRLHSNLTLDATFGTNGKMILPVDGAADLRDLLIQPDDKIVAVGKRDFGDDQTIIARLNANGAPDISFGFLGATVFDLDLGATRDDSASGVAIDFAGRITITGESVEPVSGESCVSLARVLANGQPDSTFGEGAGWTCLVNFGASLRGRAIAVDPVGWIMVAVEAVTAGNYDFVILALHDGDVLGVTEGFDLGGTLDDRPRGILLRPDGKIVVAGRAVSASGDLDFAVMRLWSTLVFFDDFESGAPSVEWDAVLGLP